MTVGDMTITNTPKSASSIPEKTFLLGRSCKNKTAIKKSTTGPAVPIIDALILGPCFRPKKKKVMFTTIPKKPVRQTKKKSQNDNLRQVTIAAGKNISAAPTKRISAKVNG